MPWYMRLTVLGLTEWSFGLAGAPAELSDSPPGGTNSIPRPNVRERRPHAAPGIVRAEGLPAHTACKGMRPGPDYDQVPAEMGPTLPPAENRQHRLGILADWPRLHRGY